MRPVHAVASWLVALLIPLALIGLGVRALLTPAFLQFEYRLPGFPPDDYGFNTAERLHWGTFGIDYLLNGADISYLGDLKFANGAAVFNPRELSHMHDVKGVTRAALQTWYAILALLLGLAIWAWRGRWLDAFRRGLMLGGWGTLGLAVAGGGIATLGAAGSGDLFWQFFTDFHSLFFTGDTWLFAYSDTLIRLYPIKFWEDAILYIGIIAALTGAALAFGLNWRRTNTAAS